MSALQHWKDMIQAEHAQTERMRQTSPPDDHWQAYAQDFRVDPHRTDDPLLNRLLGKIAPNHSLIDVGAGGGRYALPLALACKHVIAVEPSPSMAEVLFHQKAEYGIDNLCLVQARWEGAEVDAADVVICCHVVYTIQDIEDFVRKLGSHARELALVVLYNAPPQSQIYPLWKVVHGEARLPLPSLPQFEEVLRELSIDARIETLPPNPPRGFESPQQALKQLTRQLYIFDSQKQELLRQELGRELEEQHGIFRLKSTPSLQPTFVSWRDG